MNAISICALCVSLGGDGLQGIRSARAVMYVRKMGSGTVFQLLTSW